MDKNAVGRKTTEKVAGILAFCAGNGIGLMGFSSIPMWFGTIVTDFGVTDAMVGRVVSTQLAITGLVALGLSGRVHRLPWRLACRLAAVLLLVGYGLSGWTTNLPLIFLAQGIVGLGQGILMPIANGAAASSADPHRTFSFMSFSPGTVLLITATAGPQLVERFGRPGIFGLLMALTLIGLLLFNHFPRRGSGQHEDRIGFPRNRLVLMALISGILIQVGNSAFWSYTERIGLSTGLSLKQVGLALGGGLVISLIAPVLSKKLGTGRGLSLPLCGGLAANGVGVWFLTHATTPPVYIGATIAVPFTFLFAFPYFMATYAGLDNKGRVAALGSALALVGNAIGPFAGGLVITQNQYATLGWFTCSCHTLTIILLFMVTRGLERMPSRACT